MNTDNLSRLPLAMSRRMIGLAGVTIVCLAASSAMAFQVYGAINDKWRAMGGQSSPLGAPRSDEAAAANGGRFNNFQYGFIYWHPRSGAHAVYGLIGEKWNALGRERGVCGYPASDEYDFQGGRRNNFERGFITSRRGQRSAQSQCGGTVIDHGSRIIPAYD